MKYIVISLVIYFVYKFMFQPTLQEPEKRDNLYEQEQETKKKKKNFEEDYIDYEEVE